MDVVSENDLVDDNLSFASSTICSAFLEEGFLFFFWRGFLLGHAIFMYIDLAKDFTLNQNLILDFCSKYELLLKSIHGLPFLWLLTT